MRRHCWSLGLTILVAAACARREGEPDPVRLRAFVARMDATITHCGGVATAKARQCVCERNGAGVRCHQAPDLVAFRGDSVPVHFQDVLVYSPAAVPSYERSDGSAAFWSDAWNSHIIPVGGGWYRVGNCPLCD